MSESYRMGIRNLNWYLCLLQVILVLTAFVSPFNLDTKFPILYQRGTPEDYFGFSVGLLQTTEGYRALITAPRANSNVSFAAKQLHRPGALLSCAIPDSGAIPTCEEVAVNQAGNRRFTIPPGREHSVYEDKLDDMWLGVSLDVQQSSKDNNIVICGHLWKNQAVSDNYYANGACYVMNRDLSSAGVKKLVPFQYSRTRDLSYYYEQGEAGTSVTFSEDGQDILLGSPGFRSWRGTFISYTRGLRDTSLDLENPIIPETRYKIPVGARYIGYSITSGKFYGGGTIYSAVGAPRDGNYRGKVYIFGPVTESPPILDIKQEEVGGQFGEYFGASVSGIDLNNDGRTDLLVGAPFFSFQQGGDEGKVYVYTADKRGSLKKYDELYGLKKPYARFGNCIGSIGDLNQDGFNDVAIGAPYEDENGAVYIYHGTSQGLNGKYAQRIGAEDFPQKIAGFGISISRGLDIDNNFYPDMLIGSYASSNAVLLRTHPVIKISSDIKFEPSKINKNFTCLLNGEKLPCFDVIYCLKYSGKHVEDPLEFEIQLDMDSFRRRNGGSSRGFFFSNNIKQASVSQKILLNPRPTNNCFNETAYVQSDIKDEIKPVFFSLSYELNREVMSFCQNNSFSKHCPVIDPKSLNNKIKSISFQLNCGEDNKCTADLVVKANVLGNPNNDTLIIGQNNTLTLDVKISNRLEQAYASELLVRLEPKVPIVQRDICVEETKQQEEYVINYLRCDLGNSLKKDKERTLQIKIDVKDIDVRTPAINVFFDATTASEEVKPEDNSLNFAIIFAAAAGVNITGNAEEKRIPYTDEKIPISIIHKYYVRYFGPSPVNVINISLSVPTVMRRGNDLLTFLKFDDLKIDSGGIKTICNVTFEKIDQNDLSELEIRGNVPISNNQTEEITFIPNVNSSSRNSRRIQKRSAGESVATTSGKRGEDLKVDCKETECETIHCEAGPFLRGQKSITIILRTHLNLSVLSEVKEGWNTIEFITNGKISMSGADMLLEKYRKETTVETLIVRPGPPTAEKVAKWIIFVSIGAGVLLLLIILGVMIKTGFFKRKQRDKMKRMMHQASLKELQPQQTATADDKKLCQNEQPST